VCADPFMVYTIVRFTVDPRFAHLPLEIVPYHNHQTTY